MHSSRAANGRSPRAAEVAGHRYGSVAPGDIGPARVHHLGMTTWTRLCLLGVGLGLVVVGACGSTGVVPLDKTAACSGNTRPDLCEQAYEAVVAELGGLPQGSSLRFEHAQCANDRCWMWVHVTPADGGPDQQLAVDWAPGGRISVSHVVPAG